MAHIGRVVRGAFAVLAGLVGAGAVAQTTPFPTDASQLPRHCLAVANGAGAVGHQFTSNAKAVPLAAPGDKLHEDLISSGVFSREELTRMRGEQETLANQAREFLARSGIPSGTRNPTNEAIDEVAAHLEQCRAWVAQRPPVIPALPKENAAMIDHCIASAAAAQNLGAYTGNRSGKTGVAAARVARNARDLLSEAHQTGVSDPKTDRERLKPPGGELYLQGMDLLLGLKMGNPGPIEELDVRSVRLLDERVRACHKAMGLQMPLQ
jgi:hypothetical protein